ncbi:hypothetical protein [Bacilliculturomica massiliensis]|uniref:hypothetical protein n=1 Tax=Bacilliculturomica massiliensis TaxID=1917867 RepID=UPI001031B79F|nr:hypothetical protein [Bacilliculturomica massiliensis]
MNKRVKELNRLNNEMDGKLNEENRTAMTDMVCYIRVAGISENRQEEVRNDLLSMTLDAQERGESLREIAGGDLQGFCDQIIASLPPAGVGERVLEALDTLVLCTAVLGAVKLALSPETYYLIRALVTGSRPELSIVITLGDLLQYAAVTAAACGIVLYIAKNAFSLPGGRMDGKEKSRKKILRRFGIGCGAALLMALVLLVSARLDHYTIVSVNMLGFLCIVALMFAVHKILNMREVKEN